MSIRSDLMFLVASLDMSVYATVVSRKLVKKYQERNSQELHWQTGIRVHNCCCADASFISRRDLRPVRSLHLCTLCGVGIDGVRDQ